MRTGLRIVNTTEGEIASCEITYPSGDTEEFTGPDADAILDRAEQLATASTALINQLNVLTTNQPGGSAK